MKLITETVEAVKYITEEKNGVKSLYIQGPFLVAETKNKNGRIYPRETLVKEAKRYTEEYINKNRAFGELGHPDTPSINLDRVSHLIVDLKENGNIIEGKAKILDTPMGKIAKSLMEGGATLGVSSRGMGSLVEKNGLMEVQKDFRLATVDIVSDPSGPGCFVNGIMEGVDWIYDPVKGTWHEEKLHETRKAIHKMSSKKIEEEKMAIFEEYISSLMSKNNII